MTLRLLQLSDIHFGQERNGTVYTHEDVRDMLILDAGQLAKRRGPPDLVLVAGDVAYSGKDVEFRRAAEWLDKLTESVGCDETAVRVIPGNHDCDRELVGRVCRTIHKDIRSRTPKSAYGFLEDLAKGGEDANPLLPKLRAYREFAASYDSPFGSTSNPSWTKEFRFPIGITVRLVGMNSVQVSDGDDASGVMILGSSQYVLPVEPNVVYVVVVHHPLDWFMDKAEAKPFLHNRCRMILVGHEHVASISKTVDDLKNERLEISSGATNPSEDGALYRNSYNWIELSLRENNGAVGLSACIFPRTWVPERTCFAADTLRLAGEESSTFEIACGGVVSAAAEVGANAGLTIAAGSENLQTAADRTIGGDFMSATEDAALAKLKLLFWRHLDWQKRLKALVQADVLPPSAGQPVPQTMERLAIERAKALGKLAVLWDAMAPHLPVEKQQPNPFRAAKPEERSC